eukprot:GILK01006682.1.p1 GENE.GILK01006682.1~~GILK01006682.1.p1  ORF type:complete len:765 (+),score=151.37 GILK01006682.1:75-2297(+)
MASDSRRNSTSNLHSVLSTGDTPRGFSPDQSSTGHGRARRNDANSSRRHFEWEEELWGKNDIQHDSGDDEIDLIDRIDKRDDQIMLDRLSWIDLNRRINSTVENLVFPILKKLRRVERRCARLEEGLEMQRKKTVDALHAQETLRAHVNTSVSNVQDAFREAKAELINSVKDNINRRLDTFDGRMSELGSEIMKLSHTVGATEALVSDKVTKSQIDSLEKRFVARTVELKEDFGELVKEKVNFMRGENESKLSVHTKECHNFLQEKMIALKEDVQRCNDENIAAVKDSKLHQQNLFHEQRLLLDKLNGDTAKDLEDVGARVKVLEVRWKEHCEKASKIDVAELRKSTQDDFTALKASLADIKDQVGSELRSAKSDVQKLESEATGRITYLDQRVMVLQRENKSNSQLLEDVHKVLESKASRAEFESLMLTLDTQSTGSKDIIANLQEQIEMRVLKSDFASYRESVKSDVTRLDVGMGRLQKDIEGRGSRKEMDSLIEQIADHMHKQDKFNTTLKTDLTNMVKTESDQCVRKSDHFARIDTQFGEVKRVVENVQKQLEEVDKCRRSDKGGVDVLKQMYERLSEQLSSQVNTVIDGSQITNSQLKEVAQVINALVDDASVRWKVESVDPSPPPLINNAFKPIAARTGGCLSCNSPQRPGSSRLSSTSPRAHVAHHQQQNLMAVKGRLMGLSETINNPPLSSSMQSIARSLPYIRVDTSASSSLGDSTPGKALRTSNFPSPRS